MSLLDYQNQQRLWGIGGYIIVGAILFFLIAPLIIIIPLSFHSESYLTFPMAGFSTRWYSALFASSAWRDAFVTSFIIAGVVALLSTCLGTLAAFGLVAANFRAKGIIIALIICPMMVPHVIVGVGLYQLYASLGLVYTFLGMVLAHTVLAAPFVFITVTATLARFNENLIRAGAIMGATPFTVFRRIVLPLIMPGVMSGFLLAFVASFDELIVALMIAGPEYTTIPRQMWAGVHEDISPVIASAATLLIVIATAFMILIEGLRRRGEALTQERK